MTEKPMERSKDDAAPRPVAGRHFSVRRSGELVVDMKKLVKSPRFRQSVESAHRIVDRHSEERSDERRREVES